MSAPVVNGYGNIEAKGGDAYNSATYAGGNGGGGRIAVRAVCASPGAVV